MKKFASKTAVMVLGAAALLMIIHMFGWDDDIEIYRTNKRIANRAKMQNMRLKDAYGDGLENKTGDLVERARNGRDVNSRYNDRLDKYNNQVNGVGYKPLQADQQPAPNPPTNNNPPAGCNITPSPNLPQTAPRVWSEETPNGMKWHWPINAAHWVKLTMLEPGQTASADPAGIAWTHPCLPNMGPVGETTLSPLAKWLPAPGAGAGALIAKLGENGQPTALTGPFGHPLTASGRIDLYVFINDFYPGTNLGHGTEIGSSDNLGDLPVYIK